MLPLPKNSDISWLAGWLEGEGSFHASPQDNRYPTITVGSTDLDVVERAAALLGTPVRKRKLIKNYKQVYQLIVGGEKALAWMETLYPLMGTRRKAQIEKVLANKWARQRQTKHAPAA